jgi:ring-1,2-phenylacetyl-CoA epoxidase subunit PaaB
MNSLDPRVNRLSTTTPAQGKPKEPMDQFGTYEVFVQPKSAKPFQHEGIVHAPNLEMAYVLAKEAFTRRFVCVSLYVVDTRCVVVSHLEEGDRNVYHTLGAIDEQTGQKESYEIYHLAKRGKQHIHAATLEAGSPTQALLLAKDRFLTAKGICNVWAIRAADIRFTVPEDMDLWNTLPEKKFRDAAEYKGGERLRGFLEGRR